MARPGSSTFASRIQPRFDSKVPIFSVRKTITFEFGEFVIDQPFLVEEALKFGFTLRRIKLLYDRKFLKQYPEGSDMKKALIDGRDIASIFLRKLKEKEDKLARIKRAAEKTVVKGA